MSLQRPLDCYRVLEIGTGPASYCGRVLADLGARVIHLEPPGGDPMKHQSPTAAGTGISYLWANAGKGVLEADLDDADRSARQSQSAWRPPRRFPLHGRRSVGRDHGGDR